MLTIKIHSSFKKDYKRVVKRGYDIKKLMSVIDLLVHQKEFPIIIRITLLPVNTGAVGNVT